MVPVRIAVGLSKKAFKRAVGTLYRERKVLGKKATRPLVGKPTGGEMIPALVSETNALNIRTATHQAVFEGISEVAADQITTPKAILLTKSARL